MGSRAEKAKAFKEKSDESFEAARVCLQNGRYRAACNRAWYATMQIISAAVYEELQKDPPPGKSYFPHEWQATLFRDLISEARRYYQERHLIGDIQNQLTRRIKADYGAPEHEPLCQGDAEKSIRTAENVRYTVRKLVGPAWS